MIARGADTLPDLDHVVVIGESRDIPGVTTHTWAEVLGADDRSPAVTVRPADLARGPAAAGKIPQAGKKESGLRNFLLHNIFYPARYLVGLFQAGPQGEIDRQAHIPGVFFRGELIADKGCQKQCRKKDQNKTDQNKLLVPQGPPQKLSLIHISEPTRPY